MDFDNFKILTYILLPLDKEKISLRLKYFNIKT